MELLREPSDGVTVLTLRAESLDASNSKQFKRLIEALIEPHAHLVLDLNQVQFVDSAGISVLLSFLRQLSAVGGEPKLCAVTKPVRLIFELVRMHRIFEIFNTRDEAVKSFHV